MILMVHCSRRKGFMPLSLLIRWAEQLPFSHLAIEVGDASTFYVYEAVMPKVRELSGSQWRLQYEVVRTFRFDIPKDFEFPLALWLRRQIGKEYGFLSFLPIALGLISKRLAYILGRFKWDGCKRMPCSELAGRTLIKFFGVDFGEHPDTISLRDVLRELLILERKAANGGNLWISRN